MDKKWLGKCINAGEILYGEFPLHVLKKMYEIKCPPESDEDMISSIDERLLMQWNGEMITPVNVKDGPQKKVLEESDRLGNPYASMHLRPKEIEDLRDNRWDIDEWYIPTEDEISQLAKTGYIRTDMYDNLHTVVSGNPELEKIWKTVASSKVEPDTVLASVHGLLMKNYVSFSYDDLDTHIEIVDRFVNGINRRQMNGWSPKKLRELDVYDEDTIMVQTDTIYDHRQRKPVKDYLLENYFVRNPEKEEKQQPVQRSEKIGRNDPCPCGSGKKYKQCHGRMM